MFACPPCVDAPVLHPHQFFSVTTSYSPEWRPRRELSLGDALEFPTVLDLIRWAPRFPSVVPFCGAATHHITIKPVIPDITTQFTIPPIYTCSKAIWYLPTIELPLGYIKYSFPNGLREVFSPFSLLIKNTFSGTTVILETVDFLDGRRVTTYGYLDFDKAFIYLKGQGYHCEDNIHTYPLLLSYCLTPRIPADPWVHISVHHETVPL